MAELLQPLRVPAGWRVTWNTLFELDPTPENVGRGYFGESSLFSAVHEHLRLWLDVEWRPEDDPSGEYRLMVEYAPWERAERGRRRKGVPLEFKDSRVVHQFLTRERAELVRELEAAFVTRREWVEHS
ncbi:MAG: hypothetical protein C0467_16035 [Planctomycetaceae bacterium]|nr:hypothetical protein [Planctomycetaceae bacterium]